MNAICRFVPLAMLAGWPTLAAAGDLEVTASTPDVEVSTRPAGRNFMQLPTLRYDMVLNASCPDPLTAQAVSLSIADTRVALGAERLLDGPSVEVSISVPAGQIAPVAVEDFCTTNDAEPSQRPSRSLRIPSVLSAQAALTCAGEETTEITYQSASLDVLLSCEQDSDPTAVANR